jgi:uncharacterized damage-inducible protein DinB
LKKKTVDAFTRIEKQREELCSLYDSLSPEQHRLKPGPEEWNLLQVLRHLITAEKQSFLYIKRKSARPESIPNAGTGAWFRHLILRIALMLPIKYKAPAIAEVKEPYPDYPEMKQEWQQIRSEMKEFIENSDDDLLAKALYRHPRAGLLNMHQALEFIGMHASHHHKQIQSLINQ